MLEKKKVIWVLACHVQVNTVNMHAHTIYQLSLSAHETNNIIGQLLPHLVSSTTDTCIVFIQNRRGVWPLSPSSWRYVALEAQFHVKQSYSLCWEAKVPAVLSPSLCHPSASPLSVSPSAHIHCATMNLLPILPHTATCHWKESITLSAHSERAVKRPVRAIKPSEWRAAQRTLKKILL